MKYNVYKILHIPSAEIHIVKNSHSKNVEQFRQELEIAFTFARNPVIDVQELFISNKKLLGELKDIHLRYKVFKSVEGGYFFEECFWIYQFVDFLTLCSGVKDVLLDFQWDEINIAEYELLVEI